MLVRLTLRLTLLPVGFAVRPEIQPRTRRPPPPAPDPRPAGLFGPARTHPPGGPPIRRGT